MAASPPARAPTWMSSSDRADLPVARHVLRGLGFAQRAAPGYKALVHQFHDPAWSRGAAPENVRVELHWALWADSARRLGTDGLWERSVAGTLLDRPIRTLSVEDTLLHLSIHRTRSALRLRWVVDVAELVGRYGRDLDWAAYLERARPAGARTTSWAVLSLARDLFDAPVPGHVLDALAVAWPKRALLERTCGRAAMFRAAPRRAMSRSSRISRCALSRRTACGGSPACWAAASCGRCVRGFTKPAWSASGGGWLKARPPRAPRRRAAPVRGAGVGTSETFGTNDAASDVAAACSCSSTDRMPEPAERRELVADVRLEHLRAVGVDREPDLVAPERVEDPAELVPARDDARVEVGRRADLEGDAALADHGHRPRVVGRLDAVADAVGLELLDDPGDLLDRPRLAGVDGEPEAVLARPPEQPPVVGTGRWPTSGPAMSMPTTPRSR